MSQMTRFSFIFVIAALIVGFSACDELVSILSGGDAPQVEGVSGEIPVGLVYPVTGRLATFALPIYRGFELALEEINYAQLGDARIKFIVEDDLSTIEGAAEAYRTADRTRIMSRLFLAPRLQDKLKQRSQLPSGIRWSLLVPLQTKLA